MALIIFGVTFSLAYRGRKPICPVEFTPPECKLIHFSAFWHGYTRKSDLSALIVQWAQMGCVQIQKDGKRDVILIKKKKLPEHRSPAEKKYFDALFNKRKVYSSKEINSGAHRYDRQIIGMAVSDLLNEATSPIVYAKGVMTARSLVIGSSLLCAFLLLAFFSIANDGYGMLIFIAFMIFIYCVATKGLVQIWNEFNSGRGGSIFYRFLNVIVTVMTLGAMVPFALFYGLLMNLVYDPALDYANLLLINGIWILLCLIFAPKIIKKRTEESQLLYGKMLGFKKFVQMAEVRKLQTLLQEIPDYYDEILPYCMVMGLSSKIDKKFAYLKVATPEWAIGFDLDDIARSVFNCIKSAVKVKPVKDN